MRSAIVLYVIAMKYDSGLVRPPVIFVSSIDYELKQLRQNIKDFIEDDLGYESVLSEYPSFPDMDTTKKHEREEL